MVRSCAASALLVMGFSACALGQSWTFQRIVDTNTPVPGGTETFAAFAPPTLSDGGLSFTGVSSAAQDGVYVWHSGALHILANDHTVIPGAATHFSDFFDFSSDAGVTAFEGSGGGVVGLYSGTPGNLLVVADNTAPIPGGTGAFSRFTRTSIRGGSIGFLGWNQGLTSDGVYRRDLNGTIQTVADQSTPVPGGAGTFQLFSSVGVSLEATLFTGQSSGQTESLYVSSASGISAIADVNTPIPGGSGMFASAAGTSINNGRVAFVGGNATEGGVFLCDLASGAYTTVVRQFDPAPGGGNFGLLYSPTISGNIVGFGARLGDPFLGPDALFASIDGQTTRIIGEGDVLDGRVIRDLFYNRQSQEGGTFSFAVRFVGLPNLDAIYTATLIPAPGTGAVLVGAGFVALGRRRRLTRNSPPRRAGDDRCMRRWA
jgi:hypothetical protein